MSNMIKRIDYFPAGYCSSHSGLLFKGIPNEKMQFPAGVFLIHHREKGYILYDTGYHYEIKKKARYFWYRLATPMQMKKEDQIDYLLQERGIDPADITYVILSHSMASLESLAWQEKYPDEVKALVGLDWALPASYEDLKDNQALLTVAYWSSKIGLLRYFPESFYIKNPTLTETERQQYKLLAYKQLMSQAMLHESRLAKENAKKVPSSINPKIPALLLVSNGEGTTFSQSEWQRYAERFASDQSNVQVVYMDAPHDLYHYKNNELVSRIEGFLTE